jgi:hypothetical protein
MEYGMATFHDSGDRITEPPGGMLENKSRQVFF